MTHDEMIAEEGGIITFKWEEKKERDTERVGAMWYFKHCDVNQF